MAVIDGFQFVVCYLHKVQRVDLMTTDLKTFCDLDLIQVFDRLCLPQAIPPPPMK